MITVLIFKEYERDEIEKMYIDQEGKNEWLSSILEANSLADSCFNNYIKMDFAGCLLSL